MSGTTNKIVDPETIGYTGAVGHEKAIHQTHFQIAKNKFWKSTPSPNKWVRVAPGKYVLVKKTLKKRQAAEGVKPSEE